MDACNPEQVATDAVGGAHARKRRSTEQDSPNRVAKRSKKPSEATRAGVFSCFSLNGSDASFHRRSQFSDERRKEVRGIRRKGACLRCKLLKRACSGEDPCKTCIATANAAAGSRALMWMECIRPTFQTMNIFETGDDALHQSRINNIMNDLLNDDVSLDFHIPFTLNVEAASSHLASWLCDDETPATFSVVGIFSSSTNTSLLGNALDPSLGRDLRLFVHLTTHMYTTGMEGGYRDYSDAEIKSVRDCVGKRLLLALDPLLRPTEIETSVDKLGKLKSMFLLLLGTTVGMRYTCPDLLDGQTSQTKETESKQEALLRLLCHYLIYIGKAASLLEKNSDETNLLHKWKTSWNKSATFTWNNLHELEMHYRIEPPADWVVASSEDESMSNIDIDLSELGDADELTFNSDLLKCAACGMFCVMLDVGGLCQDCRPLISFDYIHPDNTYSDNLGHFDGMTVSSNVESSFNSIADMQALSSWDFLPAYPSGDHATILDVDAFGSDPDTLQHQRRISPEHTNEQTPAIEDVNLTPYANGILTSNNLTTESRPSPANRYKKSRSTTSTYVNTQPIYRRMPYDPNKRAKARDLRERNACSRCRVSLQKSEVETSVCGRCEHAQRARYGSPNFQSLSFPIELFTIFDETKDYQHLFGAVARARSDCQKPNLLSSDDSEASALDSTFVQTEEPELNCLYICIPCSHYMEMSMSCFQMLTGDEGVVYCSRCSARCWEGYWCDGSCEGSTVNRLLI